MLKIWKSVDDRIMAGESDAEQSMPEQPFPKTPSVRESDSIMDADDDENTTMDEEEEEQNENGNDIIHDGPVLTNMDEEEDEENENGNDIIHDRPALTSEGADREDLIKKII